MSATPPPALPKNNTGADDQANNTANNNVTIPPPPIENATAAVDQPNIHDLLQTLFTKLEQQEASTWITNERLDALASA